MLNFWRAFLLLPDKWSNKVLMLTKMSASRKDPDLHSNCRCCSYYISTWLASLKASHLVWSQVLTVQCFLFDGAILDRCETAHQEAVVAFTSSGNIWECHHLICSPVQLVLKPRAHWQGDSIRYFLFIISHMNRTEDAGVTGRLSLAGAASLPDVFSPRLGAVLH